LFTKPTVALVGFKYDEYHIEKTGGTRKPQPQPDATLTPSSSTHMAR